MMPSWIRTFKQLSLLSVCCFFLLACNRDLKTNDTLLSKIEYPALLDLRSQPKKNIVVIDARSPALYQGGHIPGAINIPIAKLQKDPYLDDADVLVVYASGWTDYLSVAAGKKLLSLEYKKVRDFRGGMELWRTYGGHIVKGPRP